MTPIFKTIGIEKQNCSWILTKIRVIYAPSFITIPVVESHDLVELELPFFIAKTILNSTYQYLRRRYYDDFVVLYSFISQILKAFFFFLLVL